MNKYLKLSAVLIMVLAGGFWSGVKYNDKNNFTPMSDTVSEIRQNDISVGKLINPLLQCDSIESLSNKTIKNLKTEVQDFIDKNLKQGSAEFISVYFRDLNNGPWFGIQEKEKFMPGSLLKVPLMISILKLAEKNPDILDKKILYESGQYPYSTYFKPEKEVKLGEAYSVSDLMESMIKYSDNNASLLLSLLINKKDVENSYSDLGIDLPENSEYSMQVRTYASFFRILFNATYLNKDLSEKALELLANTTFKVGIVAGVPANITVAHKFGERELGTDTSKKQLHDCGIVYFPKAPYVLCIMTRGSEFGKLSQVIKDISRITYRYVDKEK